MLLVAAYILGRWRGVRFRLEKSIRPGSDTETDRLSGSPVPYDTSRYKENILGEHFWITATTLGLNAFLITQADGWSLGWLALLWVGLLNIYALFLVVHRAASHAGKLVIRSDIMNKPQRDRSFRDKAVETGDNLPAVISHIPFVVCELSGAFFFILLIVTAYVGVLVVHVS